MDEVYDESGTAKFYCNDTAYCDSKLEAKKWYLI
jgi:alpha-D-ribose 1-methylphosphonate 5-phosphate C-P lyase